MARHELMETSFPANYKINIAEHYFANWLEDYTADLGKAIFTAMADFLKFHESKNSGKVGLKIVDFKGNFIAGGIVSFVEPEEVEGEEASDAKGNWTLDLTFDQSDFDFPDVYDSMNVEFGQILGNRIYDFMKARFYQNDMALNFVIDYFYTIHQYLDTNCKDDEVTELEIPGYFVASVGIEDGEKVFSIVPGEIIKQSIKDDVAI